MPRVPSRAVGAHRQAGAGCKRPQGTRGDCSGARGTVIPFGACICAGTSPASSPVIAGHRAVRHAGGGGGHGCPEPQSEPAEEEERRAQPKTCRRGRMRMIHTHETGALLPPRLKKRKRSPRVGPGGLHEQAADPCQLRQRPPSPPKVPARTETSTPLRGCDGVPCMAAKTDLEPQAWS